MNLCVWFEGGTCRQSNSPGTHAKSARCVTHVGFTHATPRLRHNLLLSPQAAEVQVAFQDAQEEVDGVLHVAPVRLQDVVQRFLQQSSLALSCFVQLFSSPPGDWAVLVHARVRDLLRDCSPAPSAPLWLGDGVSVPCCQRLDQWWASTFVNALTKHNRHAPVGTTRKVVLRAPPWRPEIVCVAHHHTAVRLGPPRLRISRLALGASKCLGHSLLPRDGEPRGRLSWVAGNAIFSVCT